MNPAADLAHCLERIVNAYDAGELITYKERNRLVPMPHHTLPMMEHAREALKRYHGRAPRKRSPESFLGKPRPCAMWEDYCDDD